MPTQSRVKEVILASLFALASVLPSFASDNLSLGTPGKADQIIDREGYALGYDYNWKIPRWVTYRLTVDEIANPKAGRSEDVRPDPMPVSSRKAAPVELWPDTGWWLSTNSNKRHNKKCENYRKTRGYPCFKEDGVPSKICGG